MRSIARKAGAQWTASAKTPTDANAAVPQAPDTRRMSRLVLVLTRLVVLAVTFAAILGPSFNPADQKVLAANNPVELVVENLNGSQFVYVVFHALDRDGFCNPPAGAVSRHPVLGIPVDFVIEAGDGVIIQSSGGAASFGRSATGVTAFSTAVNAVSASPIRSFAPLVQGITDECQAWIQSRRASPGRYASVSAYRATTAARSGS